MPKRYIVRRIVTDDLETYLNDLSRKGFNVISVSPDRDHFVVVLENICG